MRVWICWLILWLLPALAAAEPSYELSYLVIRSSDGEVLYSRQPHKMRTPASTLKAVTAVAALERLGPEHRFRTTVASLEPVRRGRLTGDLYLVGEADPELGHDDFRRLASRLVSETGLRRLEGDLVVDPGPFSEPLYGPGWAWDDMGYDYSPEIVGLALEGGVWEIGQATPPWLVHREGDMKGHWLLPGREGALVVGDPPARITTPRSALRSGEVFAQELRALGVTTAGSVREGSAEGTVALAEHRSRSLGEILKRALAVSDNLAMELVWRACGKAVPRVLEGETLRMVDGCGLSRYNLVSVHQLVSVLRSHRALAAYLPKPGEGTLKHRFLEGWATAHLVAKTGTMSNISGLTGYLFPGTERECVFAIVINGHLESTAERKAIEDELVEAWAKEIGWPYVLR